ERGEPRLPGAAFIAGGVRETFRDHIGALDTGGSRLADHIKHRLGRHGNDHAVGPLWQVAQRAVTAVAGDLAVARVDRPSRDRKTETLAGSEDVRAGPSSGLHANKRNRAGP